MIGKLFLGALAAAVVAMIWGVLFWAVLPFSSQVIKSTPNEEAVVKALKESGATTGVYLFPGPPGNAGADAQTKWMEKSKAGPNGMIILQKEGADPMAASIFIKGFIHYFVSALLAGVLLLLALPNLPSYGSRVLFLTLLGFFAGFFVDLSNAIWWQHPWNFSLLNLCYATGCWLVAALVMAWLIRPARELRR